MPDLRALCGVGPDTPLLVYSGSAAPQRGLATVVEALPLLAGVHLALVVSDPDAPHDPRADRRRDRVHAVPYVPHDQVPRFLAAADAGLIPIHHWPNHEIALITKFFEYSHARLPIVVSDVRTMAETVRATGQGEVFRARDAADWPARSGPCWTTRSGTGRSTTSRTARCRSGPGRRRRRSWTRSTGGCAGRPMSAPDVSVIVAVYNTMPYLTECLTSLVGQSIGAGRMQIVAVDDGSTDRSGAELDRFAARHPGLFTVVHQRQLRRSGRPVQPRAGRWPPAGTCSSWAPTTGSARMRCGAW